MPKMSEGIRNVAHSAIDTVEETYTRLVNGGQSPEAAIKSASILTKGAVDTLIREKYERQNAARITHSIKKEASAHSLN